MRYLTNNFLKGSLVLFPIVAIGYGVWFVTTSVDAAVRSVVTMPVPGGGVIIAILLVIATGIVASNMAGRAVAKQFQRLMRRLPIIGLLYSAIRDIVGALVGQQRGFDQPVVVQLGEMRLLGFLTCEHFEESALRDCVAVYVPQSYDFTGNVIVVPRQAVQRLAIPGPEFLAFVLSGGIHGNGDRSIEAKVDLTLEPPVMLRR